MSIAGPSATKYIKKNCRFSSSFFLSLYQQLTLFESSIQETSTNFLLPTTSKHLLPINQLQQLRLYSTTISYRTQAVLHYLTSNNMQSKWIPLLRSTLDSVVSYQNLRLLSHADRYKGSSVADLRPCRFLVRAHFKYQGKRLASLAIDHKTVY